jgi:lipopolysaccharide transport system permease protein
VSTTVQTETTSAPGTAASERKPTANRVFDAVAVEPLRMIAGLWARRELVWQFTHRNIELRHRGSRLGALWALLNPLSMLGLYFVLFGLVFKQKFGFPDEKPYDVLLAMFLGLSMFHAFSETMALGPMVIVSNPNFVKKVVFPLEVLPVAQVGASAFHMLVAIAIVVVGSVFDTPGFSWQVMWLPVLLLPLLLAALGMAWGLSALGVFLRDIGQLTAFLATALLFASAIMYAPSSLEGKLHLVLRFNPLLQLADIARRTVLWHQPMDGDKLVFVYVCAIAVFFIGATFFSLLRKSFAEVL